MKIFKNKYSLQKEILNVNNIYFIPTMGGLHKGHLSLIKHSKNFKGKIIVSIYVNPKQFNKKEDYTSYPRNLKRDIKILSTLGVNYLYLPTYEDIFTFRPFNGVYLNNFSKKLCGKKRKGHFKGVVNVVNRFLEIIKPKFILLGLKDFQQLQLIKNHIIKRKINTKVIPCKTIRESNGVACSTRNNNLDQKSLNTASRVFLYLHNKKKILNKDIKKFNFKNFRKDLIKLGVKKIEYLQLLNLDTLKIPKSKKENFNIFISYYLGETRLIDNI